MLNKYFEDVICKYNLRTESKKVDYRLNEEGFYRLRDEYNNTPIDKRDYRDLFLLACYSINHLIRFNSDSQFNAPSGSDGYNWRNFEKIKNFQVKFKKVQVINGDALSFDFENLTSDDFVYCDPPYTNTSAVYNEHRAFGGWDETNDYQLFEILEKLNKRNIKWALSNVFINRDIENTHLIEWCSHNSWNVYHLDRNYNPFSRGNSDNDEVLITNYKNENYIRKGKLF